MKKLILCTCLFIFSFLLKAQTSYTVCYTYDAAGNRETRSVVSTPVGGIIEKEFLSSTNESEVMANITIFPNPTSGVLHFRINDPALEFDPFVTVKVYSLGGSLIFDKKYAASEITIDISNEPSGTYLLDLHIGTERKQFAIIKQ